MGLRDIEVTPSFQTDTSATAALPDGMILGLTDVYVVHAEGGESNPMRIIPPGGLGFACTFGGTDVAVFDAKTDMNTLIKEISLDGFAMDTMPTHDRSRVYVAMPSGRPGIALIDAVTLEEVDADPATSGVDVIPMPGGVGASQLAVDPEDHFLYAAGDEQAIYVIDIRPGSPTFHQVVQTVQLPAQRSRRAELVVGADGKRLYTGTRNDDDGFITVINIDPEDQPTDPNANSNRYREVIAHIDAGGPPHRLFATTDPHRIAFAYWHPIGCQWQYSAVI